MSDPAAVVKMAPAQLPEWTAHRLLHLLLEIATANTADTQGSRGLTDQVTEQLGSGRHPDEDTAEADTSPAREEGR